MKQLRKASATRPSPALALKRGLVLALGGLLMTSLGACGEKNQELGKHAQGTTVTRDTEPYTGEGDKFSVNFKRDDKTAWEDQLRYRIQGQDEYSRAK